MCCVIIGTIPLPLGFVEQKNRAEALGFCLRQQNPRAGGLFLNPSMQVGRGCDKEAVCDKGCV